MTEEILKVRKKGVTILPKRLRELAGVSEDSVVRAQVVSGGILLRPLIKDPVAVLEKLPTSRRGSSVATVRKLRRKIDRETRREV